MNIYTQIIFILVVLVSLPYWLPPLIIRFRMYIFTRINGEQTIQLPSDDYTGEDFRSLYGHPAVKGRSKGAALSDLFWYWLSPGPEMHPEHIENGIQYTNLSRFTRHMMALARDDIETLIDKQSSDPLRLHLNTTNTWCEVRLRDVFMPVWADFFYEVVFNETCTAGARKLITDNANDVVSALKCCKLRDMKKRNKLTEFLMGKLSRKEFPHEFPSGFSLREQAYFLQGTFFNTAIVQMSEAMSHLILALAQHPACQTRLRSLSDSDVFMDNVINESLRLYPLFGIAHRITTEPLRFKDHEIKKDTVVCFNYPNYHQLGYENPELFNPDRWTGCPVKNANFLPFGIPSNRSCPAQGLAMIAMRRITKHVINEYFFASPIVHTRSMPNRGPCLVTTDFAFIDSKLLKYWLCPGMKIRDRWEDLYRSLVQLILGTGMILHAKKLRLCEGYFTNLEAQQLQETNTPG